MTQPLAGIRVIDLSRALAGPYCTSLLADMGAEVIKVESINGGDNARQWAPFDGEHSLYFDSVNRNKRSICIDFYSDEGHRILERLIAGADVLVENFRLGTLDKLGLTASRLKELSPELIVGSVSGFGLTGPLKDDAGLDQVVQGMSGLMSITGPVGSDGYRLGVSIVDITSGIVCAFGIASALAGRAAGHPVSTVSTSLLETALNLSVFQGQRALSLGEDPVPQGNDHPTIAPYGTFRTATEPLNIAVANDKQWQAFCGLLGAPDLIDDERFDTGARRSSHRDELKALVEAILTTRPAAEWIPIITSADIPCGPISTYTQVFASPQVAALGLVHDSRRGDGSALSLLRGPLSLDQVATTIEAPPPMLGEHTTEVMAELGYSDEEIRQLESERRIRRREQPRAETR